MNTELILVSRSFELEISREPKSLSQGREGLTLILLPLAHTASNTFKAGLFTAIQRHDRASESTDNSSGELYPYRRISHTTDSFFVCSIRLVKRFINRSQNFSR